MLFEENGTQLKKKSNGFLMEAASLEGNGWRDNRRLVFFFISVGQEELLNMSFRGEERKMN